ncbi:uncharacterized protein PV06_07605 [Exophiala oligosperma]|uniref:Calcofluor white hypersensitive protein n=2 Tax=Chaetothyriales TaxID=34395 RepID=A0A0D2AJY2_9EURO|nr:uncharacterized protein PV06_07605 [Exophiala oligosperma]KAJ9625373.1 hypothetical protein H2204_010466 [Knufia peltigerae]KIW40401.1 hypothetical protein PV06_07605 [Exophiala oligosperma]
MSRRGLTIAGLALAGGAGYYLYSAGGDPKVAQKNLEADAHKLSAEIKHDLPGKGKEAEKKGEAFASQAGREFDRASADAKARLAEAEAKAKEVSQKTGTQINSAIDKFDKTVEDKAAKAKSGISSWFGGK